MATQREISAQVRLAITQWPQDAPRGAVSRFCEEHGISRKSFYAIRARARAEGASEAWEPRSRRPRTSPGRTDPEVITQALQVREGLAADGLDFGPISVMDKMRALGMHAPSRATLARAFRAAGVARAEPGKRPRSSYRRFVHPAPNCMWQLDGFTYPIAGGREATILQVIDDHSRMILASAAATGETTEAALTVVRRAIAAHGVPQRFLSDNGAALNPTRRGRSGQLVTYLTRLGVKAITGREGKPTTQGKSERHHRTTTRWLDAKELAQDLTQLQTLLEDFEVIYNTERPHQGLPTRINAQGELVRITPQQAWQATPKIAEPAPPTAEELPDPPRHLEGQATRTVPRNGRLMITGTEFNLGTHYAGQHVHILWNPSHIEFFDHQGTSIYHLPRPAPGTPYVGNQRPRGFMANQQLSPKP